MSLRTKIIFYLIVIHLIWAGMAVFVFYDNRIWLLVVELFFAASIIFGVLLVRAFFVPLQLIKTGAELMNERDFTCTFVETGQPEMDELIRVYNRMIEALREERLKLTEQHYFLQELINASPAGIIVLDYEGKITDLNPSAGRLILQTKEQATGRRLKELGDTVGSVLENLALDESRVVGLQASRRVRCQKSVFFDRGFPRNFILLEELTEELRLSEKRAYEKLIRMMSHEVNNSVGAISSLLESCANYSGQIAEIDRGDFENALMVASQRAQHLNSFMRRFAEVVRLPLPDRRPCDVVTLLDDLVSLVQPELAKRQICLSWDIAERPDPVSIDKNQMEQVFLNILKNAVEAIGQEGRITIRVGGEPRAPVVTIQDSGAGIPPELQQNLFTPFFTTKAEGQGIGLTLIQEILTQHGFQFALESEPGKGARFSIWMK
ncbi:MAG: PAS domain-containing protein [Acidobacteria bacterium]|nr:MAG: PAS domain-containing protein [Acidobacteriota bacterium]